MTWQLSSFTLLFLALAAGFVWYERSHPSSKVLALVATLAALAAIGRIAFAPLPNVKPTTDIVLLSGFALGGAPGFAVGAVAALASNLVFGQGPWTPWQMAGWGMVGVLGAVLGSLSGRQLGRWPLAIACMAAGFAYGALLDFSAWVTFTGEHTLREYLVISASSFGFNVAHAVGNLVFCLAFGPVFVRALLRFRERFEVEWVPLARVAVPALAVAVALTALTPAAPARAQSPSLSFLLKAQNADGGFGTTTRKPSSVLYSAWASMGLAAAGRDPGAVRRGGGASLRAYLEARSARLRDTGDIERHVLALAAAGGRTGPLVAKLKGRRRRDGSIEGLVNRTAFLVLALRAGGLPASDPAVRSAARWVAREQNADGGFSFAQKGAASGIDDTAAAMQALVAGGRGRGGAVAKAARFLVRRQNRDGGFPLQPGGGSNAQSTAWAIQALIAAGRRPQAVTRNGSRNPLAYLRSLVGADGSVRYSRTSRQTPVWVTAQALTALAGATFPIARPRAAQRAAAAAVPAAPVAAAPPPAQRRAAERRRKAQARRRAADRARAAQARERRAAAAAERAAVVRLRPTVRSAGVIAGLLLGG